MRIDYSEYSDEKLYDLLSESKGKSKPAFEELYARHSTNIYTYCSKILADSDLAHDVFQETFVKFFESAKKPREMKNVKGYLITIARNLCINEKSKKHVSHVSIEDFHFPSYDKSNENKEIREVLETAVEALPEEFKEVIVMKEYLDMTYKDIADALGIKLSTVRIRIFRAKSKLREILNPFFEDYHNE